MNKPRFVSTLVSTAALLALISLSGCQQRSEPEAPAKTPHRTDFTPEEFGVGREHTKSDACNREIDGLLDQIRVCVNTRPEAECARLQDENNKRIRQIKNSRRCSR